MFSSMSSIEILFERPRLPPDERRLLSRRALAVDEIAALEHTAVAGFGLSIGPRRRTLRVAKAGAAGMIDWGMVAKVWGCPLLASSPLLLSPKKTSQKSVTYYVTLAMRNRVSLAMNSTE
jgi:hypothetical protein